MIVQEQYNIDINGKLYGWLETDQMFSLSTKGKSYILIRY